MGLFDRDKRTDTIDNIEESDFVKKLQKINEEKANEAKASQQYDPLEGYQIGDKRAPKSADGDVADSIVVSTKEILPHN